MKLGFNDDSKMIGGAGNVDDVIKNDVRLMDVVVVVVVDSHDKVVQVEAIFLFFFFFILLPKNGSQFRLQRKQQKEIKTDCFIFSRKKKFFPRSHFFEFFLSNDRMPVVRNRQSFTLPWRTIGRNGQIEILLLKATNFKMMIARFESWGWST